ncbi:MAG: hypothetical protein ACJ8DC_03390 [Gemmatimonadales bacterium]
MRKLLLLSAGLALAACSHRGEETGAAPDRGRDTTAVTQTGDTTAVTHAIDSTRTGPPGVAGRPPGSTVTPDSTGVPSQAPRDSTLPGAARDTGQVAPQDTSAPGGPGQLRDSTGVDTTGVISDTTKAPRQ